MKKVFILLAIMLLAFSQLSLGSLSVYAISNDENDIVLPSEHENESELPNNEDETVNADSEDIVVPNNDEAESSTIFDNEGDTLGDNEDEYLTNDVGNGVAIIGYRGNKSEIVIPSEINGKPVIEIGYRAFANKSFTSVSIPSSVTTIGEGAFAQNQLTSVEIPLSVTTIGDRAFSDNQLTSVEIPSGVTMIGESAFAYNQLTSVEIPSSVTTIGSSAFYKNQLTSIEIPSRVKKIEPYAFAYNQLTSIKIPPSVTTIEIGAFSENQLTSIELPPSVTTIGNSAFAYNQLTSIKLSSGVTTIGERAFFSNQLTSIEIPASVKTIENYAFAYNQLDFITFQGAHEFRWATTPFKFQFKSGKSFLGWFEDEDYTINWSNTVSKPMTVYAKWSPVIVMFDTDGGNEVPSQTVEPGDLVKAPSTPVKGGYTFVGWYKDKGLVEAWNFDQNVVKKDITLYAKWSKASYIVTFDANGGSEVPSLSVGHSELVKAPAAPKKAGYTFDGWHKDNELTVPWDFTKDVVTKNVMLYAKWTKDHTSGGGAGGGSGGGSPNYKVTFDSNGGSKVPSQTVGYNDLVKAPSIPEKEGYQFVDWYKDKELNNAWDFAKDKVTAEITLYAKWTKDYTVTFDSNGGSEVSSQTVPYKALVKAPSNPKKEGYLFIGWYKNEKFTKAWDFAKDVVTEDLTLYARWMKDSKRCDITFKDIDHNWAQDMIKEVAKRCIIIGYPDGTFRPNDMIQRQHVVLMIDRALQPASIREAVSFLDVPKSHVNYEQITRLQRAGIVDGSNGAFRPNASITRAEMAKILVLAFGLTPEGNSTFKDVDPSHWASGYIATLADHNIALGDDNGNFRPNDNLTRAEFTACVYRALGL
ncbi:InlB B-repeat-containing protein [Lysinibacillus sp. NPDC056232]|uniref:InlB B-repeat-containing protein n=1 Tax=Lysinibacillus sp. NPDC056232 TaxID=3345756 RepID=UPI0035DC479E